MTYFFRLPLFASEEEAEHQREMGHQRISISQNQLSIRESRNSRTKFYFYRMWECLIGVEIWY